MKVNLNKLSHHPINTDIYNLSNIEELSKSIEEVGLLQKMVINKKLQIISGSRRFESIKLLNWNEVDVDVKDYNKVSTIGAVILVIDKFEVRCLHQWCQGLLRYRYVTLTGLRKI